ncbi:olfactory receptor 5D13-like [Dama dama]
MALEDIFLTSSSCGNQRKLQCDQHSYFVHRNQANQSAEVTFILLGFSEYPQLQLPLFLVFLTIYTVTVLGNLGMILIIKSSSRLRTPMYFFLSHLSFVDFCYSTVVTPKLLENLVVEDRTISFTGCLMQFFFVCIFVVTETFLLAVMAYDRFVAICNPLLYTVVMSQRFSFVLVIATYSWGIACSLIYTLLFLTLSFCGTKFINNFVCEHAAIVAVSCSDPYINQEITLASATFNEVSSLMIILTSYVCIFITVLKMPSTGGRNKAFSTCASHLTAITIFHGSIIFLYCVPNSKSSWLMLKVGSVFYAVVIPMLNPLIYSLRNKDVKAAVRKLIKTNLICQLMINHSYFVHKNQANQSAEVTVTLLGFSEYPQLQLPLFLVFLTIYTVTVLGNLA